jgi:hypothetical protein
MIKMNLTKIYFCLIVLYISTIGAATSPAPLVLTGRFSDDLQNILIRFSLPTDRAHMSSTDTDCERVISTVIPDISCHWPDHYHLQIRLGASSNINLLDTITLRGGVILHENGSGTYTEETTIKAQPPALLPSVTATISGPTLVSQCQISTVQLVVSVSGQGGRPFDAVEWTVVSEGTHGTALPNYLGAASSYTPTTTNNALSLEIRARDIFDARALAGTTVTIQVQVWNWLKSTTTARHTFQWNTDTVTTLLYTSLVVIQRTNFHVVLICHRVLMSPSTKIIVSCILGTPFPFLQLLHCVDGN